MISLVVMSLLLTIVTGIIWYKKRNKKSLQIFIFFGCVLVYAIYMFVLNKLPPEQETSTYLTPSDTTIESVETTATSSTSSSGTYEEIYAELVAINPNEDSRLYFEVNENVPFFTVDEYTTVSFEDYSELDELGRCGVAYACLSSDTQPEEGETRGSISSVKPSGWVSISSDDVDGGWLYNRSHLIGWQLSAENANRLNLITGTRSFNVSGMLPYEDMVDDYLEDYPNNHVLYRVTPIYGGDNLVAYGVLMEAYSVEDNGSGVQYCVYVLNNQPNWVIDFATGDAEPT